MKVVDQIRDVILQELYSKYSSTELAKKTGLSRKTVYNYISTGKATVDTLSRLCELVDIKIERNE